MTRTKILVVEDEILVADDLRETLENLGYWVPAIATSGEDAVLQVAATQPNLILMDIRLPGKIDGIEASYQIREYFNVPIVYLTANADRPTLDRIKASQPFGYILKPFDERVLSTTIEIALARHEFEQSTQVSLNRAESDTQRKAHQLAMTSHEARNPLSVIRMAAEALQRQDPSFADERKQKHLQRIQRATDNLEALLQDVMLLEQVDSDSLDMSPTVIDMVSLCEELTEIWQLNPDHICTLTLVVQGQPFWISLDEKLIWHLLNNLLSNAVKYSPQGGEVTLKLIFEPTCIHIEIQDQGIGIPPEAQTHLFEPFHRASNVGLIRGTGLGLAIVKQCVDLHKGDIQVTSKLDQGTRVTVTLPTLSPESSSHLSSEQLNLNLNAYCYTNPSGD